MIFHYWFVLQFIFIWALWDVEAPWYGKLYPTVILVACWVSDKAIKYLYKKLAERREQRA